MDSSQVSVVQPGVSAVTEPNPHLPDWGPQEAYLLPVLSNAM